MVSIKINKQNLIEKLIKLLKSIYDPEILVNIYELGLIYDIQINIQAHIKVIMTLTTPNCPVADNFVKEVKQKIKSIDKVKNIDIILTFDPAWCTEMISEEASFQLGLE
jgi:FeS assembly SUF system protein